MDVVKLPKKVRVVCYEIMDGREEALDTLESFADKYPHQVAAVKAEVAYFNLDYEKALALDLTILPWLEEWYYSMGTYSSGSKARPTRNEFPDGPGFCLSFLLCCSVLPWKAEIIPLAWLLTFSQRIF